MKHMVAAFIMPLNSESSAAEISEIIGMLSRGNHSSRIRFYVFSDFKNKTFYVFKNDVLESRKKSLTKV